VQFGGVGVDANGNVLIADEENNRIRLVAGPSSDATLSALTISDGTLTPAFAAATTAYTDTVPNATTSVTVTPTATDTNATIQVRVNGGGFSGVTSGSPSGALALNVGSNTIDVKVTAQDGTTTQTYTITVTRSAASSDANLSALTISAGTLTPAFAPGTTAYTDSVGFPVSSVTVTPTVNESHATVQAKVNAGGFTAVTSGSPSGPLALHTGVNTIQVKVTAQDGVTTKTYTISVTRAAPSSNANLSSLTISAGTLNPAFAPATTSYNAGVVANGVASVTVTPTAAVPGTIQVRVNGGTFATVASGSPSGPLALHNGVNTIQVKVTAQNGTTTKTYTITITRAANGGTVAGNFTCSGAFSGITVTGNLSVPAGATCVLLGGNVRGSVQAVNAAALQYDSVTVGGNVQITGLTGLPPGQVANSICRSTVRGSLQVTSNGRRISIGDNPPCAGGNRVDGAVQVTSNHALVRVSRNTIGGSLQCTGNSPATTGIAGSNTATGGKSGQCAGL
jgi:hypothetical protein